MTTTERPPALSTLAAGPDGRRSVPDTVRFDVDAVVFDLDSTLVDSLPVLVRAWTRWAVEHEVGEAELRAALGHGLTAAAVVAAVLPPDRVAAGLARIDELEEGDVDGVVALPGAHHLLATLPADRWTIATSGNRRVAQARLRAAGLTTPPHMVTADDVDRGKPDPEPFLLAAKRLGYVPARCLVVEDSPAGLAAARAAGMPRIAVTSTHRRADLDADAVVDSLQQLTVEVDGSGLTITAPRAA